MRARALPVGDNESRGCSFEQEYNDNTRGHYPVELKQPMNRMCIFLRNLTVCCHMLGISSNGNLQVSVSVSPSPKKGHGIVPQKGHFQRPATC